jgi:hypothetical protein
MDATELMPADLPNETEWIATRMEGVAAVHLQIRDLNYAALRRQWGLVETVLWAAQEPQLGGLNDDQRRIFAASKFTIEISYNKGLSEFRVQSLSLRKDYQEAVARRVKEKKEFQEKQQDYAALFRELFGPAALVHIETLINAHQFNAAWLRLTAVYPTVPDATFPQL